MFASPFCFCVVQNRRLSCDLLANMIITTRDFILLECNKFASQPKLTLCLSCVCVCVSSSSASKQHICRRIGSLVGWLAAGLNSDGMEPS